MPLGNPPPRAVGEELGAFTTGAIALYEKPCHWVNSIPLPFPFLKLSSIAKTAPSRIIQNNPG